MKWWTSFRFSLAYCLSDWQLSAFDKRLEKACWRHMSDVRGRRQQQQQGSSSASNSPSKDPLNTPSSLVGRANAAPFVPGTREVKEPAAGSGSSTPNKSHASPRPSTAGRQSGRQAGGRGAASPRNQASSNNTPHDSPKPLPQLISVPARAGFGAESVKAAVFVPVSTGDGELSAAAVWHDASCT